MNANKPIYNVDASYIVEFLNTLEKRGENKHRLLWSININQEDGIYRIYIELLDKDIVYCIRNYGGLIMKRTKRISKKWVSEKMPKFDVLHMTEKCVGKTKMKIAAMIPEIITRCEHNSWLVMDNGSVVVGTVMEKINECILPNKASEFFYIEQNKRCDVNDKESVLCDFLYIDNRGRVVAVLNKKI